MCAPLMAMFSVSAQLQAAISASDNRISLEYRSRNVGWGKGPVKKAAGHQRLQCSQGLSYKSAGVDIDAGNELVKRIKKMNPNIGGFSGMVPFGG